MSEPSRFDPIGELVRDQVDPAFDGEAHREGRVRFVDTAHKITERSARFSARWIAFAVLMVTLGVTVGAWQYWQYETSPSSMQFTVGLEAKEGQVGTYLAPVASQPLPVQFSDGSKLRVHPASRVRVAETSSKGTSISLEAGRVDVEVMSRGGLWLVAAGPYRVRVTGTKFDVFWNPEEGLAEVRVEEGTVVVTGPSVETGVEVRAGEHFSSRTLASIKPTATSPEPELPTSETPSLDSLDEDETRIDDHPKDAPVPEGSGGDPTPSDSSTSIVEEEASVPTWNELAAHGKYEEIVKQAETRGVEGILAGGSASELHALSQAARFTGKAQLGHQCLMQLRARHPSSSQARSAAFVLGRMADQGGQSAAALQWYDTYLKESPGGALAAEALGRRMVLLHRMGRSSEAQAAARSYLDRFPKGGYAAVAKDVLDL